MTANRLIKTKGATIAVTANADVLFMPGGQVYGWTRRFANRTKTFTASEAPGHDYGKRPLRPHPGKRLKQTIVSSTPRFRKLPRGARVYAAVGSTSPYALYVDQGTGIYAGNAPYEAKILPPWAQGSPSLYERTWHPPNQRSRSKVMIQGQRGQEFFDAGLRRGMNSMRLRSYQVSSDPRIGSVLRSWPRELENFSGSTPSDSAFRGRLERWRAWRDEAFNSGRALGNRGGYRQRR